MRMNRRLLQRVDVDDVLQEIYVEYSRSLPEYVHYEQVPFHLWLRMLALRKLQMIHRHHLGTRARSADREVSLYAGPLPEVSSYSLAIQLIGGHTSPTQAAARAELQLSIQAALDEMEPIDREILALRHFEELSNSDAAQVLGISPGAASNRYVRSLRRIKQLLQTTNPQVLNPSAERRQDDGDSPYRAPHNASP
jgi:RNA polymerase sigma-70 factor (ECF subfamily)